MASRNEKELVIQTGFLAQEVEDAARSIGYDFSGVDRPDNITDLYGLRYAEFVVPLVKGMQEQQEIIEAQQKQIRELLEKNEDYEKALEELWNEFREFKKTIGE
jgi:predicted RNase H-like nuclease (RuvC/YqgF family)